MTSTSFENASEHSADEKSPPPAVVRSIPLAGWKQILLTVLGNIGDHRVTLIAAGVTYFLLLSVFPAVTAFVSIYGLFADPGTVAKQLDLLTGVVPSGGIAIIQDQLARLTQAPPAGLSLALVVSLVVALWSSSAGVRALFDAMNAVYGEREKRNIVWLFTLSIIFTLGGVIIAIVIFGIVLALPAFLGFFGYGGSTGWLVQVAGYALMIVLLLTSLSVLYRFGPCKDDARWRVISPGSIFAVLLIGIVSALYSWYAANFAHYDQTYGSLGALIGFLFWLWISLSLVIIGAELDVAIGAYKAGRLELNAPKPPADRQTIGEALGPSPQRQRNDSKNLGAWVSSIGSSVHLSRRQRQLLPVYVAVPIVLVVGLLLAAQRNDP
jgi:membrane protein